MPVAGGGHVPAAEGEMRRLKRRGKMSCAGEEQPHSPANVIGLAVQPMRIN